MENGLILSSFGAIGFPAASQRSVGPERFGLEWLHGQIC
jgi:hypothetical protein